MNKYAGYIVPDIVINRLKLLRGKKFGFTEEKAEEYRIIKTAHAFDDGSASVNNSKGGATLFSKEEWDMVIKHNEQP